MGVNGCFDQVFENDENQWEINQINQLPTIFFLYFIPYYF